MDFPKKQQQSLIPRYLLQYLQDLQISHNDPTAPWGGGGGGGSYTAGDGIDITNDVISVDDTVALKTDIPSLTGYATESWVTNQGYLVQSDLSDYVTSSELTTELSNYVTSTDLAAELLNYAELSDLATVATSGSYNDLTNKPAIPDAVSGTNDGTNWTSLTIGSDTYGLASGSAPSNMVTTNTAQTISGSKTFTNTVTFSGSNGTTGNVVFTGRNPIKMTAPSGSGSSTGFTLFNSNNYEKGYLQYIERQDALYLGRWSGGTASSSPKYAQNIGFLSESGGTGYRVLMPNKTATGSSAESANTYYIPTEITNGNTTVKATSDGIIDISSLISGGGGSSYSAGTWINIDSNNSINVYNPYISLLDSNNNPRVMISSTSNGTAPTFTATYCNITPTGFGIVDKTQGSFGGYSAAYTYYRHRNILVNNKWTLSFPTDDGTIATREWVTNKGYATRDWVDSQDYSTVSGLYSDNYWTSITINGTTKSIPSGGSAPTNMATTNTAQNITGTKTFVGAKKIGFRQANTSDVVGFTVYNTSQNEIGNLQVANRNVGGNTYTYVTLGNYSSAYTSKSKVGFRLQPNGSSNSYNFVMPYGTNSDFNANTYATNADITIPCAFTDGTTIVKADATGLVNISSISGGGGGGTTVSGTNDGTNWTSITIGSDTYSIPSGGSGGSSMSNYLISFTGTGDDNGTNCDISIRCTLKDNSTLVPGTYKTFDENTDQALINYLNAALAGIITYNYETEGLKMFTSFYFSSPTTIQYEGFTINELIIDQLPY